MTDKDNHRMSSRSTTAGARIFESECSIEGIAFALETNGGSAMATVSTADFASKQRLPSINRCLMARELCRITFLTIIRRQKKLFLIVLCWPA